MTFPYWGGWGGRSMTFPSWGGGRWLTTNPGQRRVVGDWPLTLDRWGWLTLDPEGGGPMWPIPACIWTYLVLPLHHLRLNACAAAYILLSPVHAEIGHMVTPTPDPPPPHPARNYRITDACENITFARYAIEFPRNTQSWQCTRFF